MHGGDGCIMMMHASWWWVHRDDRSIIMKDPSSWCIHNDDASLTVMYPSSCWIDVFIFNWFLKIPEKYFPNLLPIYFLNLLLPWRGHLLTKTPNDEIYVRVNKGIRHISGGLDFCPAIPAPPQLFTKYFLNLLPRIWMLPEPLWRDPFEKNWPSGKYFLNLYTFLIRCSGYFKMEGRRNRPSNLLYIYILYVLSNPGDGRPRPSTHDFGLYNERFRVIVGLV